MTHQIMFIQIEIEKLATPRSVKATCSGRSFTCKRFGCAGFLARSGRRVCALTEQVKVEAFVLTSFHLLEKSKLEINTMY